MAVVPEVLGVVSTAGVVFVAGVAVAAEEAVVPDTALAAGAVVAGAVVVLGAPVVGSAAVTAGEAVGVAEPAPGLAAGWPKPSAWKAAIMALTRLFGRNFGRSSSSWSDDFTAAVAAVEVDVEDVAATGREPAF